jgi:molecular chaperone DnaK
MPPFPAPAAALPPPDIAPPHAEPVIELAPLRAAPLLIDVTPISLGVEVAGGFCDFLIRANTPVPCDRTRVFRTASDNQIAVRVRVVQGESERFNENTYLGDLELSGLRPAPRGEVEVAVTFEIDADGILNVRAKDENSGRETVARMNLLGAQTDTEEVAAMMARQRKHEVA